MAETIKTGEGLNIKPIGGNVLVRPIDADESIDGGIIIPDIAKEKAQEGLIVEIGTGRTDEYGNSIPFEVKVGDKVLMPKFGGTDIDIKGESYRLVREVDLLGVIE